MTVETPSQDSDDLEGCSHPVPPEHVHVGDVIWADGGLHHVEWRLETGVITCCGRFVPWERIGHCWPAERNPAHG
jgi:hypothetical protein